MTDITEAPVIVVGGSLVGLSTALFLSHWNVPVILLERHPGSSAHPRAIGYTTRTVELLRSVGAASKLPSVNWTGGPPRRITVESLAGKWQQEQAWTQKPPGDAKTPAEGKPKGPPADFKAYSPVEGVAIAQDRIEPVLRERAIELGAQLKLGYTVTDWSQDDQGVSVTATTKDGKETKFRGQYLVACDGAKSPISQKLGIKRHGVGFIRGLRSILFRCEPIQKYLDHGYAQFQVEGREDGFEAFLTTYGDGRWMMAWQEDADAPSIDEATQREWVRKASGLDLLDEEIELITTGKWDIGGLIADHFSSGRVFLAGDAAHSLPPNRGGFGANTGIADAHNLAWKLSAVLKGESDAKLLDTYDAERRPVADVRHDQIFLRPDHRRFVEEREWPGKHADMLDDVAMEFGQIYQTVAATQGDEGLPHAKNPEEWKGQPGTRAPHVVLHKGSETISTLDLFRRDWVLVSKDESWSDVAGKRLGFARIGGDIEEDTPGAFEKSFGVGSTGAVLVRPDGFIAWKVAEKPDHPQKVLEAAFSQASFATSH